MKKYRILLIIGILTMITPFLGFPNSIQDWLIATYGLIIVFYIVLLNIKNHHSEPFKKEAEKDLPEESYSEPTFMEEKPMEEISDDDQI